MQIIRITCTHCCPPCAFRVIKELLVGEPSTRIEGAGAIDVPALLDREYRLNVYSYTQVCLQGLFGRTERKQDLPLPQLDCPALYALYLKRLAGGLQCS